MKCPANFFDTLLSEYKEIPGFNDEILEKKVALLQKFVNQLPDDNTENQLSQKQLFQNELAFIEYSVIVHCIFIARQLNKNARLVLTQETRNRVSIGGKTILSLNVDQEIVRMEKKIKFLDNWKQWSILQKDNLTMYQKKVVLNYVYLLLLLGIQNCVYLVSCTMLKI